MGEEGKRLKEKIIKGVLALAARNFLLNLFSFIANFLLTILLTPQIFGVFFLVSAIISFLNYFSDIGLAAALVQKKEEPSSAELNTVFFLQEILVGLIVLILFFLSPQISHFYKLGDDGVFLFQALLFSFFLASLKTIPSVLLERRLEFGLLAVPQVLENLFYYLVTIVLAFFGFGLSSFAWGAILRGFVGLVAIYLIVPWFPRFLISLGAVRNLLRFGLPFQMNSFLALVKDDLMILFLGKILSFSEVGYIGWAKKWAETPLRIIMDSVIRVTFPAYARLQDNPELLKRAMEKTIFFLALFIFPTTFLLFIAIGPLISLIPKYFKWEPAVFSFYLFSLTSLAAAFSSPMVNALNSLGKIRTTLFLMMMWTILTWILVPYFVSFFGFHGYALALLIISFTSVIPIILVRRLVYFEVILNIVKPLIVTIGAVIPAYLVIGQAANFFQLLVGLSLAAIFFVILTFFTMKKEILSILPQKFHPPFSFFRK